MNTEVLIAYISGARSKSKPVIDFDPAEEMRMAVLKLI